MRFFIFLSALAIIASAKSIRAVAYINSPPVVGLISFFQEDYNRPIRITGNLTGLEDGLHGFHVHEYGDLSLGCNSTGAHYNPFNKTHGGPDAHVRHVGDLGNVVATAGFATLDITSNLIKLSQKTSVIGRAIVIHSGEDDYGLGGTPLSNTTGNSGIRIGCGVIEHVGKK